MFANTTASIEDAMTAARATVGRDGALSLVPGSGFTTNGTHAIDTSWQEVLGENEERRQVQIQNQSTTVAVLMSLKNAGADTGGFYRLDPGVTYSFPPGVCWRGSIWMKCASSAEVAVIDFAEPA